MDWLQVVPVAAFVSAFVTLTIRWFDRPRPVLRIEGRLSKGPIEASSHQQIRGVAALINVGDGSAFDVRLYGSNCDAAVPTAELPGKQSHWTYRIPVVRSGDVVALHISTEEPHRDGEAIFVTWTNSPKRWFRRRQRFDFADLAVEDLFPPSVMEIAPIPRRTRRTRTLEQLSPRARQYRKQRGD